MKKSTLTFAVAGAAIVTVLAALLNFIITPEVLWFFYPMYAILWWPMSIYFCGRKKYLAFAVAGSLLTIAFLAATNYVESPHTLWFTYSIPPLLLWPVSMHFKNRMNTLPVALVISAAIVAYYLAVNLLTPGYFWVIYPIYFTLWWPVSMYFTGKGKYRELSIAGAAMTILFFGAANWLNSEYPWALYACFPVIWWPIAMYLGKRLRGLKFSLIASFCTIAWYGALNYFISPGSPWILFIIYPALWWPLSVYFYGKERPHWYAAIMTMLSILFFAVVNYVYSPQVLWAHYPVFPLLWWPMTIFYARKRAWFGYAVVASLWTITFLASVNILTSPGFPWSVFPTMCILWWPVSVFFAKHRSAFGFSVAGSSLTIATLVIINLLTSPGFLWSIYPSICVLWWPVSVFFAGKGRPFIYSLFGSILVIGLCASINLMTSPQFLWFVFPAFVVLWWPLGMLFFHTLRRKAETE